MMMPGARHRRSHEPQRGIVGPLRIQPEAAKDFMSVRESMSHDAIRPVSQQELPLFVAIDNRRRIRLLAFLAGGTGPGLPPDFVAGQGVQCQHRAAAAMQQLQIEPIAGEDRTRRHAELDVELAVLVLDVELPDLLAADRVTGQIAGAHEGPNVPAIGRGRRRGEVAFVATDIAAAVGDLALPEQLAVGADRHQHELTGRFGGGLPFGLFAIEIVGIDRGQKDLLIPDDRRGPGRAGQRQPPEGFFLLAPGRGQAGFVADAVEMGSAPQRPVVRFGGLVRLHVRRVCQARQPQRQKANQH